MGKMKGIPRAGLEALLWSSGYRRDDTTGVWMPEAGVPLDYSDGDAAEQYLLDTLSAASDRSLFSPELAMAVRDWPSLYHLSPERATLLRPIRDRLRGPVVEWGAGCGAITRGLGESGLPVVAVEGSLRRARICRLRCADLDNVIVVCDRVERFAVGPTFATGLLIGVLEYASAFSSEAAEPARVFLAHAGQCLRPDGRLVVAIENKVGVKYLAGAPEDHVGRPYASVSDEYGEKGPRTYGRRELEDLLRASGWTSSRFLVASPDYKLATTIVEEEFARRAPADLITSLCQFSDRADPQPYVPAFSTEQMWRAASVNRLVPDLANSFLVVAERAAAGGGPPAAPRAWHYGGRRSPGLAKSTTFVLDDRGRVTVRRAFLDSTAAAEVRSPDGELRVSLAFAAEEDLLPGRPWTSFLVEVVNRPQWTLDDLADWARFWVSALVSEYGLSAAPPPDLSTALPARALDAVPANLLVVGGERGRFVDLEWESAPPPALGHVLVRGLFHAFRMPSSAAPAAEGVPGSVGDVVLAVARRLGWTVDRAALRAWLRQEFRFQEAITGRTVGRDVDAVLEDAVFPVRPSSLSGALAGSDGGVQATPSVAALTRSLSELRTTFDQALRESHEAEARREADRVRAWDYVKELQAEVVRLQSEHAARLQSLAEDAAARESDRLEAWRQVERLQRVAEDAAAREGDRLEAWRQVERLTSATTALGGDLERAVAQRVEGERRLAELETSLDAAEERLEILREENAGLARDVDALRADLGVRLRQWEQEKEELHRAGREQRSAHESELAALRQTAGGLEQQLLEANARAAHLDEQLGDARIDQEHLRRVFGSRSWRMTAPLRHGADWYRAWRSRVRSVAPEPPGPPASVAEAKPPEPAERRTPGPVAVPDEPTPTAGGGAPAPTLAPLPAPTPVPLTDEPPLEAAVVTLIAFYLPQFHPIPENDGWWGRGFTEWTNVVRGRPQFVGHEQPHLPGELGFYDLRVPAVQRRQVELARLYGVGAFCFYFYWFGGRRLLETPVLQYLGDSSLDLPFCLCWANENWSRRWDGLDQEILMAQRHSAEDDLAFIAYVAQYFGDARYLRVGGRPLLLVYRPSLLPSARETAARWRDWCRSHGVGEIFLACTQSFEAVDPAEYGFDAAVEFPPNNCDPPVITDQVERLNPDFGGVVYDWRALVERSRAYAAPPYRLFRGVAPSWDNEARRPGRGAVFYGSSPEGYREWLTNAAVDTVKRFARPDERLVFVNAWNEWAEGVHLEPDQRYGYAYLQATREALQAAASAVGGRRVVIVAHDAHPHGAQHLALSLARMFSEDFRCAVDFVVLGDGPMKPDFARCGVLHDLSGRDPEGDEARRLAADLLAAGARSAICNTTVSGRFLSTLKRAGFRCVSLVHEMPGVIRSQGLEEHARHVAGDADVIVFGAPDVARGFAEFADVPPGKTRIRPQGLYKRNRYRRPESRQAARAELRERLGLPPTAKVVLAVGYADHRKGVDLFVEAGRRVMSRDPDAVFLWLGHHDVTLWPHVERAVQDSGLAERFRFPGRDPDTDLYYAGADVFALTSREDPFPTVVLEALEVGVPVVAFAGTGGCCDLISEGCGLLAPAFDIDAYASRLAELLDDAERARALGAAGSRRVREDFSFRQYGFQLCEWLELPLRRVSVVVPNYNYARYLEGRLRSIAGQTYPVFELIALDDASTDDSVDTLSQLLPALPVDASLVVNDANSGSVFAQWRRGVDRARGDLVWIAEADDLADPELLERLVPFFDDPSVVMAYCESRQMATDGGVLCEHYRDYTADISRDKWLRPYVEEGLEEIRTALAVKNTIPNVSAVLFSRTALRAALEEAAQELREYRVAGDWVTYLHLLARGKIAFWPEALNSHRRHESSVTIGSFDKDQLREILRVQAKVEREFGVSERAAGLPARYAQRLYEAFGLASPACPSWELDPELASARHQFSAR